MPFALALWQGPAADALLAATVAQGFSPEVALAGLRAELASWRADELERLVGEVESERGRWPTTVLILAARTLPASAMRQVLLARALGARVYLKAASGQEALGAALMMADPEVIGLPFTSDDQRALDEAITKVETVVVLGSDATVEAVAARVPDGLGFAGHGHKVSAAVVMGEASDAEVEGLAQDLLAWDQAGCLAPQVVWCEANRDWLGKRLAEAVARLEGGLPLAASSAAAVRREVVTLATMLGEASFATATAVIGTHGQSEFRSAPGPRALWVVPFDSEAVAAMVPHLSSLAVVGDLPMAIPPSVRVCRPGELQRPRLDWEQDGLHPLRSLLVTRR
jgi:hypothetical protein